MFFSLIPLLVVYSSWLSVLAPIVKALIQEALKDFERQGGRPQTLNLFGFKVPAEIANILIQRFLGGSNEKNINPFS